MNRLSEAAKFLIIAGTILIVCSLVVVGFFVMKEGKEGTNNSMAQFGSITSNHSDVELEKYHNLTISGNVLRDLIVSNNNATNKVVINYKTKTGTLEVASANSILYATTNNNYINPVGSFKGTVEKDANGVITGLTFNQ